MIREMLKTSSRGSLRIFTKLAPAILLVVGACTQGHAVSRNDVVESKTPISAAEVKSFYSAFAAVPQLQGSVGLFETPNANGHPEFQAAIRGATTSLEMVMYHLTDKNVMADLGAAAKRGVDVRVIVDSGSMKSPGYKAAFQELLAQGVNARASTTGFSLTHQKSLVIDGATAFVTSINLTRTSLDSRDLGIVTTDSGVIAEMHAVFETDWADSQNGQNTTPALASDNLAWSPVSSRGRLLALLQSAQQSIISTTENISDPDIISAFAAATARGVKVRLLVPQCDMNTNTAFNIPAIVQLDGAGVDARVMPYPSTPEVPYMHLKMIVVDGNAVYVGSINFSHSSLDNARELGILFADPTVAAQVTDIFEADWVNAILPPR